VVDQREERPITKIIDRAEEGADFELGEVARQALIGPEDSGQRRDEVRK
jgi:hypothetical protein